VAINLPSRLCLFLFVSLAILGTLYLGFLVPMLTRHLSDFQEISILSIIESTTAKRVADHKRVDNL
jgi:hypothetical protein